jgi:hypothetical protein
MKILLNDWLLLKEKFSEELLGGTDINDNWRKRYDKELTQLLGDLAIPSVVRISWLIWIGHINRMDGKRKVSQVFNNNPQGSRQTRRPKKKR